MQTLHPVKRLVPRPHHRVADDWEPSAQRGDEALRQGEPGGRSLVARSEILEINGVVRIFGEPEGINCGVRPGIVIRIEIFLGEGIIQVRRPDGLLGKDGARQANAFDQGRHVRKTRRGLVLAAVIDQSGHAGRQLAGSVLANLGHALSDQALGVHGDGLVHLRGHGLSGHDAMQCGPEPEHVGPLVQDASLHLFGGDVVNRSLDPRLGLVNPRALPQVDQLHLPIRADQDVVGLQVGMDVAGPVHGMQALSRHGEQAEDLVQGTTEGPHFGPFAVGEPGEKELQEARDMGARVAELTLRLFAE